jgi:hypothetical protein
MGGLSPRYYGLSSTKLRNKLISSPQRNWVKAWTPISSFECFLMLGGHFQVANVALLFSQDNQN